MPDRLALDSPRWAELRSFDGAATALPAALRELANAAPTTEFDELLLQVIDAIYHQHSCIEATYAVVPHLFDIALATHEPGRIEILIWLGHIAASCDSVLDARSQDLVLPAQRTLGAATMPCVQELAHFDGPLLDTYYLAVAMFALAGQRLGMLVMDNLLPHQQASSVVLCPSCGDRLSVVFFDTGLACIIPPAVFAAAPVPPQPLSAPATPRAAAPGESHWQGLAEMIRRAVPRANGDRTLRAHMELAIATAAGGVDSRTPAGPAFSLLGAILVAKGHAAEAERYFRTWDRVQCPTCSAAFVFWEQWWPLTGNDRALTSNGRQVL
jgi:hypothetical protein